MAKVGSLIKAGTEVAGTAAAGPLGALVGGALAGAPALAGAMSAGGRAHRRQLNKDLAALQAGKLGFSDAEKRQMAGEAARALQSQTRAAEADVRRQAAAAGGFGRSGAYQKALGDIYTGAQSQLGTQMGETERLSTQQALQEKARILQAAKEQRDKVAADWGRVVAGASGTAAKLMEKAKTEKAGRILETAEARSQARGGSRAPYSVY